jgi:multidrug efflux system membrane fusion protein
VGEVTFLSRSADPETRTFRVEIEVPNADLAIRDGQTAEIAIASAGVNAHLIPQSAMTLNDDGTLGVRMVDGDDIVAFAPVTIMRDTMQGVWVTGLPDTADVIVVGQEYVTAGVKVAPTWEEVSQ